LQSSKAPEFLHERFTRALFGHGLTPLVKLISRFIGKHFHRGKPSAKIRRLQRTDSDIAIGSEELSVRANHVEKSSAASD
jgi:hypothetical protein